MAQDNFKLYVNDIEYTGCLYRSTVNAYFVKNSAGQILTTDSEIYWQWSDSKRYITWECQSKCVWWEVSNGTGKNGYSIPGTKYYLMAYNPEADYIGGYPFSISVNEGQGTAGTGWISRADFEKFAPRTSHTVTFNANGGMVSPATITGLETNLITLPTPVRDGYEFLGWTGNLMDLTTLTSGDIISNTGQLGTSTAYASTKELIPFIPNVIITSNYRVCGIYTYDANGNFLDDGRISEYAYEHNINKMDTAFIRVEVALSDMPSDYNNNLVLSYTLPANIQYRIAGNQTLTAQWKAKNLINIYDGTTWKKAIPYVFDGTNWREAQAQVFNGTDWKIVSG